MHNKLSQVDKKFLRTSCAEKRWVDDGSGLAQILEDELHLTAREVPVIDPIARSEQRGHETVGHKLSTNFREFIFPLCAEYPRVSLPLPL
jgi:hypothetical protein